jgi:hypothetical protein
MRHSARIRPRDRGQVSIEFVGFLPVLLALALAGVQLGLVAYTAQQAESAARAAARTASYDRRQLAYDEAGREAMSGWLADRADFRRTYPSDAVTVTVEIPVPSIIPGVSFGKAEKRATMPDD